MAFLAPQAITRAGLTATLAAAAAGGDTLTPGERTFLRVRNPTAGAITVTVDSVRTCDQGFDHNAAVSVAAGATTDIGPLPAERFAGAGGVVNVTYSATGLEVAAVVL